MYKIYKKKVNNQIVDTYKYKITSNSPHRDNTKVVVDGIDYSHYKENPLLLYNHDTELGPIGFVADIEKQGDALYAYVNVNKEPYKSDVAKGNLRACSISFIPKEFDKETLTYHKAELVELSLVLRGNHPEALIQNKDKNTNLEYMTGNIVTNNDILNDIKDSIERVINNNDAEMINGLVTLLLQVEDLDNRRDIAAYVINDFDNNNIDYDKEEFYKRINLEYNNTSNDVNLINNKNELKKTQFKQNKKEENNMNTSKNKLDSRVVENNEEEFAMIHDEITSIKEEVSGIREDVTSLQEAINNDREEMVENFDKKLNAKFNNITVKNSAPAIKDVVVKNALGRLAVIQANAKLTNSNVESVLANGLKQNSTRDEFVKITQLAQNHGLIENAYNLQSIVDGATIYDPSNAIDLVEALRPNAAFMNIPGLTILPLTNGTATWTVEDTTAEVSSFGTNGMSETKSTFKKIQLFAKKLGAYSPFDNQMLRIASPQISNLVENLLLKSMANKAEQKVMFGTGASNQPTGIFNSAGIESFAITATPDSVKIGKDLKKALVTLSKNNVHLDNVVWIMRPDTRLSIESQYTSQGDLSGYARELVERGTIYGKHVYTTNNVEVGKIALFDPTLIVVGINSSPTTTAEVKVADDETIVGVTTDFDCAVSIPKSVCVITGVDAWDLA